MSLDCFELVVFDQSDFLHRRNIPGFDLFLRGALLQLKGPPQFVDVGATLLDQCHLSFVFGLDLITTCLLVPAVKAQPVIKPSEFFFERPCLELEFLVHCASLFFKFLHMLEDVEPV